MEPLPVTSISQVARIPVSVVIPCYRCAETIERALASVAAQSALPEKVILVEDCSGDGTLEKLYQLRGLYSDDWVQVIAKPRNSGPGETRNIGWDVASTPYVAFLDSDDSWHPRKLELQYQLMAGNPELALTGHHCQYLDGRCTAVEHDPLPIFPHQHIHPVNSRNLFLSNAFSTTSVVMLRRDLLQRFEPEKKYCEDYLLWMQIVLSGNKSSVMKLPLSYAYKSAYGEGGLTQNIWRMERGELDAYRKVFREYDVAPLARLAIYLFSLAKCGRRYIIWWFQKLKSGFGRENRIFES